MSENGTNTVANSSISKIARTFNELSVDDTIQGIKTAALLDRQITEKEIEKQANRKNPEKNQVGIPTGADIRQDYEEGMYR